MNSRERVLRCISHQETDRLPSFFLGTSQISQRLLDRFGIRERDPDLLIDRLGADVAFLSPPVLQKPGEARYNFDCGSVHAKIYDNNEMVLEKLPVEEASSIADLDKWRWPSPDWFDYEIPKARLERLKGKAIVAYDMGIVLLYAMSVRGMEQIMMDMAGEPEMAHAIFSRISDFNCERIRRFLKANKGVIDIVGIGDDVAGQGGLFFSLEMWRDYFKPHLKRMVALCEEFGVVPYFHGCGGFRTIVPDLIEIGVKCAGRFQTEAKGNEFSSVKKDFGREICVWGAIDGQHVAVEGTPEQVRAHVEELLRIGSPGSGFLPGPTHSFTEDTPIENILEAYRTLGALKL